jgi:hypothetical protein
VATVTSKVSVPAGDVAEMDVAVLTVNDVATVLSNLTVLAPVKFVPVMVTAVPPAATPAGGEIPVTIGAGVT